MTPCNGQSGGNISVLDAVITLESLSTGHPKSIREDTSQKKGPGSVLCSICRLVTSSVALSHRVYQVGSFGGRMILISSLLPPNCSEKHFLFNQEAPTNYERTDFESSPIPVFVVESLASLQWRRNIRNMNTRTFLQTVQVPSRLARASVARY